MLSRQKRQARVARCAASAAKRAKVFPGAVDRSRQARRKGRHHGGGVPRRCHPARLQLNRWILIGLCSLSASGCGASVAEDEPTAQVEQAVTLQQQSAGLSLLFSNGAAPPKLIVGNGDRFV